MQKKLHSYIAFMSRTKVVCVLVLLYLLSQALVAFIASPLGHDILRLQVTLDSRQFRDIIAAWDKGGLTPVYLRHFYPDFPHALIYSLSLSALLSRGLVMNTREGRYGYAALLPFAAGLMDVLENIMHLVMIANPSLMAAGPVMFSGICTWIKWGTAFLCLSGAMILIGRGLAAGKRNEEK